MDTTRDASEQTSQSERFQRAVIGWALLVGVSAGYGVGPTIERQNAETNDRIDNAVITVSETARKPSTLSDARWNELKSELTASTKKPYTLAENDALEDTLEAFQEEITAIKKERHYIVNSHVSDVIHGHQANITVHPELEREVRHALRQHHHSKGTAVMQVICGGIAFLAFGAVAYGAKGIVAFFEPKENAPSLDSPT